MWSRLKRIGTIAIFVAFTAIGVVMAAVSAGQDRILGLAIALFFGAGGLMWYLLTRPRSQPAAGLRIAMVTHRGQSRTAFVADYDRGHLLVASIGLVAMAAAAAGFIVLPSLGSPDELGTLLVGIGCAALLGGVGIFGLLRLRTRSQLALTRDGLLATGPAGATFAPWDAIADIGEVEMYSNRFLAIRAIDPARIEMGRLQRLMLSVQRSMAGADLTFPIRSLAVEPAELYGAIARYLGHPDLRARIGAADELAAIQAAVAPSVISERAIGAGERRPLAPTLAAASLLVVGALFGFVTLAVILGDATPEEQTGRLLGGALFGVVALAQVSAGILVIRGVRIGRWLGIGGALALVGLALLALLRSDADNRTVGLVITGIVIAHAALVAWGLRGNEWHSRGVETVS
jgi:hypothetical protein